MSTSEELIDTLKSSPSITVISEGKLTSCGRSTIGMTETEIKRLAFLSPSETEIEKESSPEKFSGGE